MIAPPERDRMVVVALPVSIPEGVSFLRRVWPAHVTLAANFSVAVPDATIESLVRDSVAAEGPIPARLVGEALFGPSDDIPVLLVESDRVLALHERLADLLQPLPGFAAQNPEHWRNGFRPHLTRVPRVPGEVGSSTRLRHLAIVKLTGDLATVAASIELIGRT